MARLLIVLLSIVVLLPATTQLAAQEDEPCPAGSEVLLATPGASPMASPTGTPTGSPTAEPTTSPTATATVSPIAGEACLVEIKEFDYMPRHIEIAAGTTVTWINRDEDTQHTATARDRSWDTDFLQTGESAAIAFDTTGEMEYFCREHGFMIGTVRVE
jgi:plastocyanin